MVMRGCSFGFCVIFCVLQPLRVMMVRVMSSRDFCSLFIVVEVLFYGFDYFYFVEIIGIFVVVVEGLLPYVFCFGDSVCFVV